MKDRLQRFMYGRYGNDNLNRFISISALLFSILSIFTKGAIANSLTFLLLFLCFFRMLSKNIYKRQQENLSYLRIKNEITNYFKRTKLHISQRKTHRFYKCPSCKLKLRVPKGKGLITISCPKCKDSFNKKT